MTTFKIIEARSYHCGRMARTLRAEHQEAIARVGKDAHREIVSVYRASSFRRALLIDGKLAALGGIVGMMASAHGFIWVALTDEATRYPVALVKLAREQIDEAMMTRRELATTLIAGDRAAMRFATALGFHASHEGPGQRAYSSAGRRRLMRFLEDTSEIRVPVGTGWAIALGWHPDE